MKKNIKIILILFLPIFFLACGFKPINQKDINLIYIQNIDISGTQRIAYSLKNNILLISNSDSINKYDIGIKISEEKNNKIKDKTGKVTRYGLLISTEVELTNLRNNNKIQKTFIREGDYNVAPIHSNTISNEKNAIKIIIQQLSEDIVRYISISMRNK
jgi:hypothetical protein|tara:strand:- start:578 stop:1054 length:477 start_codon:yes stop_codon:yes gene_type:complete